MGVKGVAGRVAGLGTTMPAGENQAWERVACAASGAARARLVDGSLPPCLKGTPTHAPSHPPPSLIAAGAWGVARVLLHALGAVPRLRVVPGGQDTFIEPPRVAAPPVTPHGSNLDGLLPPCPFPSGFAISQGADVGPHRDVRLRSRASGGGAGRLR